LSKTWKAEYGGGLYWAPEPLANAYLDATVGGELPDEFLFVGGLLDELLVLNPVVDETAETMRAASVGFGPHEP